MKKWVKDHWNIWISLAAMYRFASNDGPDPEELRERLSKTSDDRITAIWAGCEVYGLTASKFLGTLRVKRS